MMDTKALRALYERVYAEGKEKFFTFPTADVTREVVSELRWSGLSVLEVGCGTGETAALLAEAGATVLAIDFAEAAVTEARRRHLHPRIRFEVAGLDSISGDYDAIVLQEVIEHTDSPRETIGLLSRHLNPGGTIIVTCPSFLNVRGYVWMTLQLLFRVPMSLTDRHFIDPWDMERWAGEFALGCQWRTFRHGQGHGEQLTVDLKRRVTNALRDAGMDNSKVDDLLRWLDRARTYEQDTSSNGAKALYRLTSARTGP